MSGIVCNALGVVNGYLVNALPNPSIAVMIAGTMAPLRSSQTARTPIRVKPNIAMITARVPFTYHLVHRIFNIRYIEVDRCRGTTSSAHADSNLVVFIQPITSV